MPATSYLLAALALVTVLTLNCGGLVQGLVDAAPGCCIDNDGFTSASSERRDCKGRWETEQDVCDDAFRCLSQDNCGEDAVCCVFVSEEGPESVKITTRSECLAFLPEKNVTPSGLINCEFACCVDNGAEGHPGDVRPRALCPSNRQAVRVEECSK